MSYLYHYRLNKLWVRWQFYPTGIHLFTKRMTCWQYRFICTMVELEGMAIAWDAPVAYRASWSISRETQTSAARSVRPRWIGDKILCGLHFHSKIISMYFNSGLLNCRTPRWPSHAFVCTNTVVDSTVFWSVNYVDDAFYSLTDHKLRQNNKVRTTSDLSQLWRVALQQHE